MCSSPGIRSNKLSNFQWCLAGNVVEHYIQARRFVESSTKSSWVEQQRQSKQSERPVWSEEWKRLGLGAELVDKPQFPQKLFFVQVGFGVDQHGEDDATKASIRAVRNSVEFNSIPGVIEHIPGGRKEMLIHVKLGVPSAPAAEHDSDANKSNNAILTPLPVDCLEVAKVFPYGKLLPIEVDVGGLAFATGRVVEELGDTNDIGICVVACVTIGYNDDSSTRISDNAKHITYNTKDGY